MWKRKTRVQPRSSTGRPLKILQLCAVDISVKALLLPLIDRLLAEGHEVVACCTGGPVADELRKAGYAVKDITIDRQINPLRNLRSAIELARFMRQERFDLVHVHTPVAAFIGRLAALMARVPAIIYTAHGFYFHERMSPLVNELFVQAEKLAARIGTDFLFTQSEEDRETALRRKFLPQERVLTIGNGVDVRSKFDPCRFSDISRREKRAELGLAQDEIAVLFLGRLVREKGIFDLLRAFGQRQQRKAKLLLVGDCPKSERDRHSAGQLQRQLASSTEVLPLGVRADVPELLHASDVFVLPSYREGMPRSIIEAMSMGKPVVATNIRGCREEVLDGETGFLVEVGDVAGLRQRLDQLIADGDLRQRLGQAARLRAEVHFDEQQVIDRQIAVIARLLQAQPASEHTSHCGADLFDGGIKCRG